MEASKSPSQAGAVWWRERRETGAQAEALHSPERAPGAPGGWAEAVLASLSILFLALVPLRQNQVLETLPLSYPCGSALQNYVNRVESAFSLSIFVTPFSSGENLGSHHPPVGNQSSATDFAAASTSFPAWAPTSAFRLPVWTPLPRWVMGFLLVVGA